VPRRLSTAEVSRILAISRSTLYHKIRRYRLGAEEPDATFS